MDLTRDNGAWARLRAPRGQSIVEFAIVTPLLLILSLGVVETSWALLDQHVTTKLAREGSNLISRDASLEDARNVLRNMQTPPINFNNGNSTMILSVLMKGTTGANQNQIILFARHQYGTLAATSKLVTAGGSFGGAPNYEASNPDGNTALQVTNLNDNMIAQPGGFLYVTEIFTRHQVVTPLDRLGLPIPSLLYSIAYF